ncbi:oligosaccharide flippase family protein, partial [Longimicrobium sp.]|uniref:oligosaccharide flippase family protein n=1 Tax=Longimicrobium sp. TaxID=2029185 RepID=UPI002E370C94
MSAAARTGVAGRFGRGRLARGIVYRILGAGVPAVLGLVALPRLVAGLGAERMGILTLGWAVLGYLGVLQLGVGPALTRAAAGADADGELGPLAWTGVAMTTAAGLVAGVAVFLAAPLLADTLRLSAGLRTEAVLAFRLLAVALPFTLGAPALSGLLEAHARFGWSNAVAAAVSAASYLGPLGVLAAGGGLPAVLVVLAAARGAGWLVLLALCLREVPALRSRRGAAWRHAGELLRFGGWATVSSVVSPVMVYMDRFVVGALVSAAAVAWYATPQEVMLRMGIVSGAVSSVLFPAFAAAAATHRERLGPLLTRGVELVFVMVMPLAVLLCGFSREGLGAWLGPEFAAGGAAAVAWLGLGLLVNGFAKPASALVQGIGRPDVTARLHVLELPLYLALLF